MAKWRTSIKSQQISKIYCIKNVSQIHCAKIVLKFNPDRHNRHNRRNHCNSSNDLITHAKRETRHKSRTSKKIIFQIHTAGVAGSNPASPTMTISRSQQLAADSFFVSSFSSLAIYILPQYFLGAQALYSTVNIKSLRVSFNFQQPIL